MERAELFIAATGSDECNMLSCFIAKRMGAKHTIARVRNPEYSEKSFGFMRQELDISMIMNPDQLAAQDMYYTLKLPGAVKIEYFARRSFEMVELRLKEDSPLCGVQLYELRKRYDAKFLICAVQRGDSVVIPDGNYVLQPGDRIELTAAPSEISKLLKLLGILRKQSKSVMILGASRAAYYLTRMLLASGTGVTVIEKDHQRCQHFSELLPGATVICNDGSKQELLMAEGLTSRDAFVSLTGMDEENILVSFFALSQGLPKVITKVNRDELHAIAERLGLDSLIASRHVSSNVVSRYARALQNSLGSNMEALYRILDGKAEAIEFAVHSDCALTDIPLAEMRLRSGILIAGIIRGRKTIIPSGTDCIYVGDHIIVLAAGMQIHQLTDILLP